MVRWTALEILLVVVLLLLAGVVIAQAQPVTPYFEYHLDDPTHWYDPACCSNYDCEPLPPEAVEDVRGGWHVRYMSKRGLAVDVFVPARTESPSQDGRFHGCASASKFKCLYVPSVS